MRPRSTPRALVFALAALCFAGAAGSDPYQDTTPNMPGCTGTTARGVNTAGQIVGTCTQATRTLGFLYSGGSFSPVEFPGATVTIPSGIDNVGQVVGSYALEDGNVHGFLYAARSFSTIDVPGATATQPLAIDDVGQIVGSFTDSRGEHAFLYFGGIFATFDAPGAVSTAATGIDNAGEIVGWFTDTNSRVHEFRYAGGAFSRPDALTAKTSSSPSPCDVTGNGVTNVADVQAIINQALGVAAPNNDLNSDGVINVTDIQVVINADLQKGCTPNGTQGSTAVAHLTVQSGNGQVACVCITATLQSFQPISVKATDINGNPVSGATVTWTDTLGQMNLNSGPTTVTDSTGVATQNISFAVFNNFTSTAVPYDVFTIRAASNNQSVTFTETQSLITSQGSSVIEANAPQYGGAQLSGVALSANIGATLTTPIQTQIAGLGVASNGVANVSVRVLNGQSSPAVTCNTGTSADPGSVLSDSQGNTACYLTFSGSGTGTFYLLIGGVPGTNIGTALDLEAFGPYTFTSLAGPPAAVKIVSGNNQVVPIGQTLAPLVAQLVDAQGNVIPGQTMSWSVSPAGAASLNNGSLVTNASGEVSTTVSLDVLASAGVTITAALQSNPSIAATFNETIPGALTAMTKISGDNQTAAEGAAFPISLVVQLVNASGPVENFVIHYTVSGPVTLDTNLAATDVNGEATVTATAGSSTGTATVTATAGALTKTFTLTVIQ